jgi:hypothetical protein
MGLKTSLYDTKIHSFFTGRSDKFICFYCDGGIRFWLHDDNVWTEHSRWFPNCVFVRYVKVLHFIRTFQDDKPTCIQLLLETSVLSCNFVTSVDTYNFFQIKCFVKDTRFFISYLIMKRAWQRLLPAITRWV